MRQRTVWRAMTTFLMVACTAAPSSTAWDGEVTFRVDLEAAQRWTATGDPVDRGDMCPRGTRQVLHAVDAVTGEPLRVSEEVEIIAETIERRIQPPVVWTTEHTCTDGSGSFVSTENWAAATWTVESGTGAYRDLRGEGELAFTTADYTQIAPRRLTVEARLAGTALR